jgi:hypothetical protein
MEIRKYGFSIQGTIYLLYHPESGEFSEIERNVLIASESTSPYYVSDIPISDSNTLWGLNVTSGIENKGNHPIPLFSKFNEEKQQFEPDYEGPFYDPWYLQSRYERIEGYKELMVKIGRKSDIWVYQLGEGLLQYNTITHEQIQYQELAEYDIDRFAISPDNIIYFSISEDWYDWDLDPNEIFKFDINSREISPLSIPEQAWPDYGQLFVMQNGNLWIGIHGFYSADGNWYLENPDPDSYIDVGRTSYSYNWALPSIMMESSNGYIWFENNASETVGDDGIAWYDPASGDGCWITNNRGIIVEDQYKHLWMIMQDKLFSMELP